VRGMVQPLLPLPLLLSPPPPLPGGRHQSGRAREWPHRDVPTGDRDPYTGEVGDQETFRERLEELFGKDPDAVREAIDLDRLERDDGLSSNEGRDFAKLPARSGRGPYGRSDWTLGVLSNLREGIQLPRLASPGSGQTLGGVRGDFSPRLPSRLRTTSTSTRSTRLKKTIPLLPVNA